jgi:hypothetical protein
LQFREERRETIPRVIENDHVERAVHRAVFDRTPPPVGRIGRRVNVTGADTESAQSPSNHSIRPSDSGSAGLSL